MRIYISGPITNNPEYMEQFAKAAKTLEARGYKYINPAELNKALPDAEWEDYMLVAFELLRKADAITMLTGWDKSNGAKVERALAFVDGLPIYDMDADRFEEPAP